MAKKSTQAAGESKVKEFVPSTKEEVDKATEGLIVARIGLLMNNPFWGNIISRLNLINSEEWCPTAATDGRNFYFNPKFVNLLKPKEIQFLFGHELLHAIYDHVGSFGRLNGRNPQIWNLACDYAVNYDLVEFRIGEKITTIPVLYDQKYKGMVAEEIYEDLLKNCKQVTLDQLTQMVLDDHMDGDGDGGDGDEKGDGSGSGKPKLSESERQAIKDELKEAMLSAAHAVGVGNVPAGIRRMIKELTEPEMDWRQVLQQQIESQVKSDFTYMRPSRRGWSCDAVLPSMKKEPAVECTVALDLSGSIGNVEMKDFMSELYGICQQHSSYKITLLTWDCSCYYTGEFTEDDADDAMLTAELKGGGGTSPACIWKWCEDNGHDPKQLVILTDGYVDNFADKYADKYPTLWMIYNNPSTNATNGMTVHFGKKH